MAFWNPPHSPHSRRGPRASRRRVPLQVEALECRTVPYAASGNAWPSPQLVTLSFEPDTTNLGGVYSNLFATFNTKFGSTTNWENAILKAAQTWASYTNLNFSVVSDNGTAFGGGSYQQGDPGMGDIRVGGNNFNDPNELALAIMPPPVNNYSVAGDIMLNTGQPFNINGNDYDLYTVALHELGHSLGLYHSTDANAVMFPWYTDVMTGLGTDDIAGIQSIYSGGNGRSPDAFDAAASNGTTATASDITSQINTTSLTALLTGLDVTTTADVDYYKFTAPTNSSTSLTVSVQSSGLSLLAPSLKIYNASNTLLGTVTGSGDFGSTLTKTVSITPGQTYYVRVAGANTTVFGTGAYAMTLKLGSTAAPTVPLPNTQLANGNPLNAGGGEADILPAHHRNHDGEGHGQDDLGAVLSGTTGGAVQPSTPQGLVASRQTSPTGPGGAVLLDTDGGALPDGLRADLGLVFADAGAAAQAVDAVFADPGWNNW